MYNSIVAFCWFQSQHKQGKNPRKHNATPYSAEDGAAFNADRSMRAAARLPLAPADLAGEATGKSVMDASCDGGQAKLVAARASSSSKISSSSNSTTGTDTGSVIGARLLLSLRSSLEPIRSGDGTPITLGELGVDVGDEDVRGNGAAAENLTAAAGDRAKFTSCRCTVLSSLTWATSCW